MGNLLKILTKEEQGGKVDIFLDFESAEPSVEEQEVYDVVKSVLDNASYILEELQEYKGASEGIREAISNPMNEDLQDIAWKEVLPRVNQLKRFYEFAIELEAVVPQLLYALCSGSETPIQHLDKHQALAKQFAEILHLTLKFDDLKMTNPAIQNDFSYYRRTLTRRRMSSSSDAEGEDEVQVSNEMANRMSLFYAYPTPLLKTLSDVTAKFVSENKNIPVENTTDCLSTLANLCRLMIEDPECSARFQNEETVMFCLRVMVGVIILYDHVHPVGAFAKNSSIDIKSSIKVLKKQNPGSVDGLLNALRYTTKHLNDPTTPDGVRALLL